MKQNRFPSLQKKTFDSRINYNKKICIDSANKLHPDLGIGLFARRSIKKGEVIFIVKGKLIPLKILNKNDSALYPNAISVGESMWLDPFSDNALVYLNHSCAANTGIRGSVEIVALRNIKNNEQITIDYSITEWDKYWRLDKRCKCGAKNCRGIIRSIHSLPIKTYNEYLPFIPRFLQKVYEKNVIV